MESSRHKLDIDIDNRHRHFISENLHESVHLPYVVVVIIIQWSVLICDIFYSAKTLISPVLLYV